MDVKEREQFWETIDSGENPLLSSLHSMTEKWGLPAILMALGDIAEVLVEDAEDAELTPNQRGLIIGCCAQVCHLAEQMREEMNFLKDNG